MALRSLSLAAPVRSALGFPNRAVGLGLAGLLLAAAAAAQTPVLLPNTITSIAGTGATTPAFTVGPCPGNPQFTSVDSFGNGCPAVSALVPIATSIAVDPLGNVYISANSTNPQIIRKIDARTGLITAFAGADVNQCASGSGTKIYGTKAAQTDKTGANCPVTYTGGFNGPVTLGMDPYGNLLIGTTGDNSVDLVCNAVSPACTLTQAAENLMIDVAGCNITGASSSYPAAFGTVVSPALPTAGTGGDGTPATQFTGTACATGVGGRVYGLAADKWDNIYFMDGGDGRIRVVAGAASITVNGATLVNPLYAVLQTTTGVTGLNYTTPVQGNVYPIAGGAAGGTVCSGNTDAGGDGCPFYQTLVNTGSSGSVIQGLAVDSQGDFIFADGLGRLRVIYMGGTSILNALTANGVASPQIGFSYALVGNGTGGSGLTGNQFNFNSGDPGIVLGKTIGLQSGAIQTLALDPAGNVIIGDQEQVLFYDIATGYLRRLATASGATLCNANAFGDGCPLKQSKFGANGRALAIAEDTYGNLYIEDGADFLIRRVSTQMFPTEVVNNAANTTALTSSVTVHAPAAGSTVVLSPGSSSEFTVGTNTSCVTNTASDGSVDCTASVTYAPQLLGQRSDPLTIATTVGSATTTQILNLNALSTGSALVFDTVTTPATSDLGTATTGNTALVLDGAGKIYVSGAQGISKVSGSKVTSVSSTPAAYLAVDAAGAVYAAAASSTTIAKYIYNPADGSYTPSTIAIPALDLCTTTATTISCASTQIFGGPLVVDSFGTVYIADLTNKHVVKFSPATGIGVQLTQVPLSSPTSMGQDSYGNLLVVDGTSVLKIPAAGLPVLTTSPTPSPTVTFSPALTAPTSVTADQGENIYVADGGNIKVQSLNGQYTLPGITGSAVAVDGAGNLYTTSSAVAGITGVMRSAESFDFGTNIAANYVGVFANAGATSATGFAQTDTGGNFTAAVPASPLSSAAPTCNLTSTALAGGSICNVSLSFTPTANGSGPIQDAITLLPATNTLGSLVLNGTKSGTNATTATTITGNTAGLIYSTSAETAFTVTVSETPAAVPSGTVAVTIDGGAAVNYPLTGATASTATATVPIAAFSAGQHTIVASYANSAGIVGSTSTTTTFSIGQAGTSVAWTPTFTTLPYSMALGATVLNATATSPATAGNVGGAFIYAATLSGGTAVPIHSASYLAIGTYSLGVTFVPTDAVDYIQSTGSVGSFTVTKATTVAAIGATQMLVAADGTGNFTTVQSAVDTLPSGGSIYIKPGTYNAFVSVVQPNIALRGLGGDPTKVMLTHEAGSFGSTYPYIGEFQATNSNGSQMHAGSTVYTGDEASATIVVAKGINTALSPTQQTPTGFYAENLSLINTYDTDTTTTTTTYASTSNGACVLGQSTPQTYSALFNTGQLCASQALVIWTNSDLSVMNNIYATSLQDTIYTASPGSGSNGFVPTRQYWFRGKVTGDIDYIFGDAAAVFDSTSIFTMWHGATATGEETIEAQNKMVQTGVSGDYLSGYIMNNDVFTSQSTGMTKLFLGRPYGTYSTWIMLNSHIDQTVAAGYTNDLGPALTDATYGEYNDIPYTDPATGAADLNGVPYLGTGGNTGSGVAGPRETSSTNPGTALANNFPPVPMTQAQAQAYFPNNFLGQTVSSALSSTTNWVPTSALAAGVNAFVPSGTSATIAGGTSVTILIRPRTPGLGAISNGIYTIPTGTYILTDTYNGGNPTVIASGSLDASGEAYFTSSNLADGTHNLSWTYSGDDNFAGSTTAAPYVLTVTGPAASATTTTIVPPGNTVYYGSAAQVLVQVQSSGGTPTGTATLTVNGTQTLTATLNSGQANFSLTGLAANAYSLTASYVGSPTFIPSTTNSPSPLVVNPYPLTVTAACANRPFGQLNSCTANVTGSYQYSDTAATVFATGPTVTTPATRYSPANTYPVTVNLTLTTSGHLNYMVGTVNSSFTVTGNTNLPQSIIFPAPPTDLAVGGSYQLTARTTSGLPVSYTIIGGTNASISGSTLNVIGQGGFSVQATQTDPTGDYAPAAAVSRGFVAH